MITLCEICNKEKAEMHDDRTRCCRGLGPGLLVNNLNCYQIGYELMKAKVSETKRQSEEQKEEFLKTLRVWQRHAEDQEEWQEIHNWMGNPPTPALKTALTAAEAKVDELTKQNEALVKDIADLEHARQHIASAEECFEERTKLTKELEESRKLAAKLHEGSCDGYSEILRRMRTAEERLANQKG